MARKRGRVLLAALAACLVLGALAAAGCYAWLEREYHAPGPGAASSRIDIESGVSLRNVLARLEAVGSVRNARAVEWYLRLQRRSPRVLAGAYEIPAHASAAQILALFESGKVILEQVTVVEGATFAEFLAVLAQQPRVAHTLQGRTPSQIMVALGHPGEAGEGEFFPDTYLFAAGTSDLAILARAYDAMQRALAVAWEGRSAGLPLASPYQALILASLVEKEAALKSERALIAGVFVNRLRSGMRLQSDPTVIYGLGESYDGSIHSRDLARDTPFNTYTREGLPPTPIALPGREALLAAVQPAPTAALYFVASGLGDGAHHFSATLEEHNSAVQTYLTRLRRAQRAAQQPRDARGDAAVPAVAPDTAAAQGHHP
ncbi:MAG TPA: endolytic transglycosylase MltG [Steroidobacteraceae bacterium]|jgi:UPF0755 protein|nr:endolytic transglycosylase MltG [Steroidobacteraceae bacterium]